MSVDDSVARTMPGVVAITPIPGVPEANILPGVAVSAQTFPQALAARRALGVQWSAGPMDDMSDRELSELLHSMIDPLPALDVGEGIDAVFEWPYVSQPGAPLRHRRGARCHGHRAGRAPRP